MVFSPFKWMDLSQKSIATGLLWRLNNQWHFIQEAGETGGTSLYVESLIIAQ